MKTTKKQRKKLLGMNAATKRSFKLGHKPPQFTKMLNVNGIDTNQYVKASAGVPYVNPENF